MFACGYHGSQSLFIMAGMSSLVGIAWYFRWSWLPCKVVVPSGYREVSSLCRGGSGIDDIGLAAAFDNAIAAGGWYRWKLGRIPRWDPRAERFKDKSKVSQYESL